MLLGIKCVSKHPRFANICAQIGTNMSNFKSLKLWVARHNFKRSDRAWWVCNDVQTCSKAAPLSLGQIVPRVTGQILACRFVPAVVGFKKGGGMGGSRAYPQDFFFTYLSQFWGIFIIVINCSFTSLFCT